MGKHYIRQLYGVILTYLNNVEKYFLIFLHIIILLLIIEPLLKLNDFIVVLHIEHFRSQEDQEELLIST